MLGNATSIILFKSDPIGRKTFRYALGIVLATAIAFGVNWPLSFMVIILANGFLLGPKPSLKSGFDFVLKFTISLIVGILLSYFFLEYDIIYMMLIGVIMLWLYYVDAKTISPLLKITMIVMVLVIPLISLQSPRLASYIGWMIVFGAIVAFLIALLLFELIPDVEATKINEQKAVTNTNKGPTQKERFDVALRTLIVVYPLILLFYYFDLQSDAVILIYVGMYANVPGFTKNKAISKNILYGSIFGGIVAFFIYETIVIVPMFTFFLLLIFTFVLWAGYETLTGGKYASIIKAGFSTIFIILGGAIASDEADAGGKVLYRVFQMLVVIIYMVLAFRLLDKLKPSKK